MWFKYFNKATWNLRVWRSQNLRFNHNHHKHGVVAQKWAPQWKDFLFKLCRSDFVIRSINIWVGFGVQNIAYWGLSKEETLEDIAKKKEEHI